MNLYDLRNQYTYKNLEFQPRSCVSPLLQDRISRGSAFLGKQGQIERASERVAE